VDRAKHLSGVKVPMLFVQGTRDEFADLELLTQVVEGHGPRARLHRLREADHSFHVLKRTGRTDAEVMAEALDAIAAWVVAQLRG
jgi:predicted alpha/beta-hydrolase family hydrolase